MGNSASRDNNNNNNNDDDEDAEAQTRGYRRADEGQAFLLAPDHARVTIVSDIPPTMLRQLFAGLQQIDSACAQVAGDLDRDVRIHQTLWAQLDRKQRAGGGGALGSLTREFVLAGWARACVKRDNLPRARALCDNALVSIGVAVHELSYRVEAYARDSDSDPNRPAAASACSIEQLRAVLCPALRNPFLRTELLRVCRRVHLPRAVYECEENEWRRADDEVDRLVRGQISALEAAIATPRRVVVDDDDDDDDDDNDDDDDGGGGAER